MLKAPHWSSAKCIIVFVTFEYDIHLESDIPIFMQLFRTGKNNFLRDLNRFLGRNDCRKYFQGVSFILVYSLFQPTLALSLHAYLSPTRWLISFKWNQIFILENILYL